ncbi:MAG: nucleotide exchange factor GrpE [Proteobacteria bacterium]|nr:nucleotide exchange factor GrpE [Pseudomonadota bacterium]
MTDEHNSGTPPEEKPETVVNNPEVDPDAEAHRKLMEDLGLDEEETPDQIKAERDDLRKKMIATSGRIMELQQGQQKLTGQLEEQQREAARAIARTQKQVDEQKDFALEKFVKEVLPVIDNLERGLSVIPKEQRAADPKFEKLAQGFEKTLGQLTAVFNKFGIKEINPQGEAFDPGKHEAISTEDNAEAESDTVVVVAQKGYELNGRVIRHAKVVVKS